MVKRIDCEEAAWTHLQFLSLFILLIVMLHLILVVSKCFLKVQFIEVALGAELALDSALAVALLVVISE